MKPLVVMAALAAWLLALAAPGWSQAEQTLEELGRQIERLRDDLKLRDALKALAKEVEAIKEGQKALQKDLQEIKTLLQARPAAAPGAAPTALLSVEGAPFKGDKTAKLTLIEFTDFQ